MTPLLALAAQSAWNRRLTLGLMVAAVALSVTLLLGVERLRQETRAAFTQSVSGVDLLVGARTSPVQLLLYAVFHLGEATANLRWQSYREIAADPAVAWAIPLALGDSHRGFPVLGTDATYFRHFRYGAGEPLAMADGRPFAGILEAVLGAEVAERLGYRVGERIVLAHGMSESGLAEHGDKPFTVVGVLARSGTPVDRTIHVSLASLTAIHLDWVGGAPLPGLSIPSEHLAKFDLTPKEISAALIGLKNRATVFRMQRQVNAYDKEALLAVLPGVALEQLWQTLGIAENALLAVSAMVVAVGLAGLAAVLLAGLDQRRRELAVLRAVGARPFQVFILLALESLMVALAGALLGVLLLGLGAVFAGPWLHARFGLTMAALPTGMAELRLLGGVAAVALLASLAPAWRAFRLSLADGLTPRW